MTVDEQPSTVPLSLDERLWEGECEAARAPSPGALEAVLVYVGIGVVLAGFWVGVAAGLWMWLT